MPAVTNKMIKAAIFTLQRLFNLKNQTFTLGIHYVQKVSKGHSPSLKMSMTLASLTKPPVMINEADYTAQ